MDLIKFVHGQDANLYTDVLRVNPKATDEDIQSAFVARRYELFNELQSASDTKLVQPPKVPPGSPSVTMSEKQFTEKKMDALIASFRLLCDSEKRRQYNMSLYLSTAQKSHTMESPNDVRKMSQNPSSSAKNSNGGPSLIREPSAASSYHGVKKKLFVSSHETEQGLDDTSYDDYNVTTENDKEQSHRSDQSFESSNVSDSIDYEATSSYASLEEEEDYDDDSNLVECKNKKTLQRRKVQKGARRSHVGADDGTEFVTAQDRKVRWSESTDNVAAARKERRKVFKNQVVRHGLVVDDDDDDDDDDDLDIEEQNRLKNTNRILFRKGRSKKNVSTKVPDESEDSEDNGESGMLSSWLRANHLVDQADMVDNITREIAGAAADTVLAFNQILNAFTIDDEAIDSVAGNIVDAAEDLETFKS
jgi:hypothetical protein